MVKSRNRTDGNGDGRWLKAMRETGLPEDTITQVVEATLTKPEDLITLEQAASEFGVPYSTLLNWVNVGHLEEKGREKYPARGGGKVLVDRKDVAHLSEHRPKRGRPRKNGINRIPT